MQAANPAVMSLVFILAASLPAVAPDAGGVLQAATDVRINSITAEDQAETAIAVNPVNPMNLFATWRDLRAGRAAIGHAFSLDGGTTWQDGVIDYPQADLLYDPSVGADSEGNFYLAFGIDFLPAGSGSETWVMKSADGGATLGPPVSAGPFIDKPFLGVDRATNAIYVAGNAVDSRGRGGVFITRSLDGGASFTPLVTVDTRNGGLVNAPAFGPGGEVYLVWPHHGGGRVRVLFNRSLDGGTTWLGREVLVASYRTTPTLQIGRAHV